MINKIDLYPTVKMRNKDSVDQLGEWQFYNNWHRPYIWHNGKTQVGKSYELSDQTPEGDDDFANHCPSEERIQEFNYRVDLHFKKFKLCWSDSNLEIPEKLSGVIRKKMTRNSLNHVLKDSHQKNNKK